MISAMKSQRCGGSCGIIRRGLSCVLMASVMACCATGGVTSTPKHIPRFAFDKDESPVNLPLMLRVILVNMGPTADPPAFRIDTDDFERMLFQLMPGHQPHCVETGEKLGVSYEIFYDVVHTSQSDRDSLSQVLKENMRLTSEVQHSDSITGSSGADKASAAGGDKKGFVSVYEINVQGAVTDELERVYQTYAKDKTKYDGSMSKRNEGVYGLMILNMDKELLAPAGLNKEGETATNFIYRYKTGVAGVEGGSDAFVTRSRFAVVDLSAGPSLYGSTHAGKCIPQGHSTGPSSQ